MFAQLVITIDSLFINETKQAMINKGEKDKQNYVVCLHEGLSVDVESLRASLGMSGCHEPGLVVDGSEWEACWVCHCWTTIPGELLGN